MKPKVAEGIRLFNTQKFFEAHEALEEVWLKAEGREKILLHGLIQVAAAFHHHSRSNLEGFRSLLEKGMSKLNQPGKALEEIDIESLRQQVLPWQNLLSAAHASRATRHPALPQIKLKR